MRDLVLKPPVPEDIGSARCVVSADIIKKRSLLVGQWVRIDSVSVVRNFIFVFTLFYTAVNLTVINSHCTVVYGQLRYRLV
jgi:hypothetical protein